MSQAFEVIQAFQATVSKEDKTPKTVTLNGNTFNAWKIKVKDQEEFGVEANQWINVNKKPGNEIKPGDEVYGDIVPITGKFGTFYNFKSASRPLGEAPARVSQPAAAAPSAGDNELLSLINDKLDYIMELLEQNPDVANVNKVIPGSKPVDLNELDI